MQCIADCRRELRISNLSRQQLLAYKLGRKDSAREIDAKRIAEINARSTRRVASMEHRMHERPRQVVKRFAMAAFLSGYLPAFVVTALFRILRLAGV